MSSAGSAWYIGSFKGYVMNLVYVDRLLCGRLWNEQWRIPCSFSQCVVFFVVHSWQNGTRCRDGVNVLWCHSHLVWLVFEGSIPTCACFHSENFFVTCSCCFFLLFFRSSKKEERQAKGRCMVCRV